MTAGYSGTPLAQKLGITAVSRVLIAAAPDGVDLDPLPLGVTVHRRRGNGHYDATLVRPEVRAAPRRPLARR